MTASNKEGKAQLLGDALGIFHPGISKSLESVMDR